MNREDPIKARAQHRRWVAANPERMAVYRERYREWSIESSRDWKAKNPEKVREGKRRLYYQKRAKYVLAGIRQGAKKQGVSFDLTEEWLDQRFQNGICEATGIAFDMEKKRGPLSPSVDRIVPGGPYTQDNCRLVIWAYNRALCNYGEDLMFDIFAKAMSRKSTNG